MNTATAAMFDGIKEACEAWGRAMRWVIQSTGEGYPSRATFERAREGELDATAVTGVLQRFGEVLLGDALAVSRAIRGQPMMPEESHRALFMHYVVPRKDADRKKITIMMKARESGFESCRPYYCALDNAYHFLLARIQIDVPRQTFIASPVRTLDAQKNVCTSF